MDDIVVADGRCYVPIVVEYWKMNRDQNNRFVQLPKHDGEQLILIQHLDYQTSSRIEMSLEIDQRHSK
jgi:hypothetical protein